MNQGLPECTALRLDAGIRRQDGGRTLIGGSPLRLLRLGSRGVTIVDDLAAGAPVGTDPVRVALARRLLDGGLAHPVPGEAPPLTVGVVVPVRGHGTELDTLLTRLAPLELAVTVVDDGTDDAGAIARVVDGRATVLRHEISRGPGAARNTGWRATATDLVAFVDADVTPVDGWLDGLVRHFADPAVAAVAPRVRAADGPTLLDRYEAHHSPLDLGPDPARVVPGGRVGYVPTATIVHRRTVLDALGGFDEALRVGEDVDLVWRTVAAGHTVRYEPAVEVRHANRGSWGALVRQRQSYGSAAAALEERHPGAVAPVAANGWSILGWALVAGGGRRGAVAGAGVGLVSAAALLPLLRDRTDQPIVETARLAGLGHLWAGRSLASATTRAWLPLAAAASVPSRSVRRALLASAVVPNLVDWLERRPSVDPVRWVGVRIIDDAAYCAGVWQGCARRRSFRALAPRTAGIEGVT